MNVLVKNKQKLGISIRGGIELGVGIYVSSVDENSVPGHAGLRVSTDRQTKTDGQMDRQTDEQTDRQIYRQTNRHKTVYTQTGGQTHKQTDAQIGKHRQTHNKTL